MAKTRNFFVFISLFVVQIAFAQHSYKCGAQNYCRYSKCNTTPAEYILCPGCEAEYLDAQKKLKEKESSSTGNKSSGSSSSKPSGGTNNSSSGNANSAAANELKYKNECTFGDNAFKQGNYETALQYYKSAMAMNPNASNANAVKSQIALCEGATNKKNTSSESAAKDDFWSDSYVVPKKSASSQNSVSGSQGNNTNQSLYSQQNGNAKSQNQASNSTSGNTDKYNIAYSEFNEKTKAGDYEGAKKSLEKANSYAPVQNYQKTMEAISILDNYQKTGSTLSLSEQQRIANVGNATGQLLQLGFALAASVQEERERKEREEQQELQEKEMARLAEEAKILIEKNRKYEILQQKHRQVKNATMNFSKGYYPKESAPETVKELFIMFYGINDFTEEFDKPTIFLSTPVCIARYSDGTWPFISDLKRKMTDQIKITNPSINAVELLGYYSDQETAETTYLNYYKNCISNKVKVNVIEGGKISNKTNNDTNTKKNGDNSFWDEGNKTINKTTNNSNTNPKKNEDNSFWDK